MRKFALTLALVGSLVFVGQEAGAAPRKPVAQQMSTPRLKARWLRLEEECRGGQHDPDDAVCTERNRVLNELERRGVCWAYRDDRVTPTLYDWHPCSQRRPKGWRP